jgi:hypothetical protein
MTNLLLNRLLSVVEMAMMLVIGPFLVLNGYGLLAGILVLCAVIATSIYQHSDVPGAIPSVLGAPRFSMAQAIAILFATRLYEDHLPIAIFLIVASVVATRLHDRDVGAAAEDGPTRSKDTED